MNIVAEYFKLGEEDYKDLLKDLQLKANEVETKFLNDDPEYDIKNFLNSEFFLLSEVYQALMFYPSRAIIDKLKNQYKLPAQVLNWFIPIEKINHQFDQITGQGVAIDKVGCLQMAYLHLRIKFNYHLSRFYERLHKNKKNTIEFVINDFNNYLERFSYHNHQNVSRKKELDLLQDKYYVALAKLAGGDGDSFRLITDGVEAMKGKTKDKIIKPMVKACFEYDTTISQTDFLNIIYDLFYLILQDCRLPDINEFEKLKVPEDYRRWRSQLLRRQVL